MKHTNEPNIHIETNIIPLKKHRVSVEIEDQGAMFDLVRSKLYSTPIQTLNQEYMANARDAHREAGNLTDRIEITVPTEFDPNASYRDFGLGLSPERIEDVVIKIFKTTKAESDDQNGGFGLGFKTGWSYSDVFYFHTYIDGIERFYKCYINEQNTNDVDLISEEPTTEKNGTKVVIPVQPKDFKNFINAMRRCSYFWEESERPNYINYDFPKYHEKKLMVGNIEVNPSYDSEIFSSYEDHVAIVDGIPYSITKKFIEESPELKAKIDKFSSFLSSNFKKFWYFKVNGPKPMPNREQLSMDRKEIVKSHAKMMPMIEKSLSLIEHMIYIEKEELSKLNEFQQIYEKIGKGMLALIPKFELSFCGGLYSIEKDYSYKIKFSNSLFKLQTANFNKPKRKKEILKDYERSEISGFDLNHNTNYDKYLFNDTLLDVKNYIQLELFKAHANSRLLYKRENFVVINKPIKKDEDSEEFYQLALQHYEKLKTELKLKSITDFILHSRTKNKILNPKIAKESNEIFVFYHVIENRRIKKINVKQNKKQFFYITKDYFELHDRKKLLATEHFFQVPIIVFNAHDVELIKNDSNFMDLKNIPKDFKVESHYQVHYFNKIYYDLATSVKKSFFSFFKSPENYERIKSDIFKKILDLTSEYDNVHYKMDNGFYDIKYSNYMDINQLKKYHKMEENCKFFKDKTGFLFDNLNSNAVKPSEAFKWIYLIEASLKIGDKNE